jgi:uncharacterized iron-regulated membrane protein
MQQPPIVVDVVKQPPVAPEITMGDVVLGAIGLTGVIILCALAAGLIVGGIFIWIRRRRDAAAPPTDPGHSRLRI